MWPLTLVNFNNPSQSFHEISLCRDQGLAFFQSKSLTETTISRYESHNGGNEKILGRGGKLYPYDPEHPQYLSVFPVE